MQKVKTVAFWGRVCYNNFIILPPETCGKEIFKRYGMQSKKLNYKHTIFACYTGYISQAIIVCYIPLLYVTFQAEFGFSSLSKITLLTTICFLAQLITDLLSSKFVDKIGYRTCAIAGEALCAVGLCCLAFLPELLSPMPGLIVSACLYAVGAGLLEVIVSPIVEACPTKRKEAAMGFLHSVFCWGSVFVVLVSTLLFSTIGIAHWRLIACLWAIIPAAGAMLFFFVPFYSLPQAEDEQPSGFRSLAKNGVFWVLCLLMVCAGATEQAISQWASTFAEKGLGISKSLGDLAGPMAFAVCMGLCRVFYAKFLHKISLEKFLVIGAIGCVGAYLLVTLPPVPVINLLGCAVCGLFVGILWPGTYSVAAKKLPYGGAAMFALLALAGDLGCLAGPTTVGFISGIFDDNLKVGLTVAVIFPVLAVLGMFLLSKHKDKGPEMLNPNEQK